MKTTNILKAGNIGHMSVESLCLCFDEEIKDQITLDEARDTFNRQGKILSDALFKTLPGGTLDALLSEMMKKRASLFIIPIDK